MPHEGKSLVVAEYPQVHEQLANAQAVAQMRILIMAIKGIRQMRADAHAPLSNPIDILIKTQNSSVQQILIANQEYLEQMAHPKSLQISPTVSAPKLALTAVIDGAQIFVPLAELVDITSEIQRQEKELTKLQKDIDFVNNKLNNPGFVKNAPQKLVEQQRTKLDSYKNRRDQIKARISELKQN